MCICTPVVNVPVQHTVYNKFVHGIVSFFVAVYYPTLYCVFKLLLCWYNAMHKFATVLNNTCCQTELKRLIQKPCFSHTILKIYS